MTDYSGPGWLLAGVTLCITAAVMGQPAGNFWHFGYRAGLHFTDSAVVPFESPIYAEEGSSVLHDGEGRLMAFTDGTSLFTASGSVMEGGDRLGADPSSTHTSLLIALPGSATRALIFTIGKNNGEHAVYYSSFETDKQLNSGRLTGHQTLLLPSADEKLSALYVPETGVTWVLCRSRGDFYAYSISQQGLHTIPVISPVANKQEKTHGGVGQLCFSNDGKKVAAANYGDGIVEVFDFDPLTGKVTAKTRQFDLYHAYGTCFAPDGRLLYATSWNKGTASQLLQYDLEGNAAWPLASARSGLGQMNTGPDGRIYIAAEGSKYLGIIRHPAVKGDGCEFILRGMYLGGPANGYPRSSGGLPAVVNKIRSGMHRAPCNLVLDLGPDTVICQGSSYKIRLDPTLSYQWNDNLITPERSISSPGSYTVTAWKNNCQASDTLHVKVLPLPDAKITLQSMPDKKILVRAETAATCSWDNGDQGNSTVVSQPGQYKVILRNKECRRDKIVRIR